MATIKVQREFMSALDKQCSIFTVVLGRATGFRWLLGSARAPFSRWGWNLIGLKKGVAPGPAHSKGSPTEARNADAGPAHMAVGNLRSISQFIFGGREDINNFTPPNEIHLFVRWRKSGFYERAPILPITKLALQSLYYCKIKLFHIPYFFWWNVTMPNRISYLRTCLRCQSSVIQYVTNIMCSNKWHCHSDWQFHRQWDLTPPNWSA